MVEPKLPRKRWVGRRIRLTGLLRKPTQMRGFLFSRSSPVHQPNRELGSQAREPVSQALALGPAHVAGISWGGTVVLELYGHHPELVATLILADTYAGWKGSLSEEELRARVESVHRMLAAPAEDFDPTLSDLFVGDPPAEFASLLADMAADVRPESFRVALLVMAEADQSDLLLRITVPTLLIWGEQDVRSPLS